MTTRASNDHFSEIDPCYRGSEIDLYMIPQKYDPAQKFIEIISKVKKVQPIKYLTCFVKIKSKITHSASNFILLSVRIN